MSLPPNQSEPLPPPFPPPGNAHFSESAYITPPGSPNPLPLVLAGGSLGAGLLGTISCGCCLLLPLPVVSLVLGVAALLTRPDQNAKVMAVIGIVTSSLTIIVLIGTQLLLMLSAGVNR